MNFEKLELTDMVRFCIDNIRDNTVQGRILKFLYEINLVDGQLKPGHHIEADVRIVMKAFHSLTIDTEVHNIKEMVEILGLNWSNASTTVTRMEEMGIVYRSKGSNRRRKYVSMNWDVLKQLHEALTTGRIVPADQITV